MEEKNPQRKFIARIQARWKDELIGKKRTCYINANRDRTKVRQGRRRQQCGQLKPTPSHSTRGRHEPLRGAGWLLGMLLLLRGVKVSPSEMKAAFYFLNAVVRTKKKKKKKRDK